MRPQAGGAEESEALRKRSQCAVASPFRGKQERSQAERAAASQETRSTADGNSLRQATEVSLTHGARRAGASSFRSAQERSHAAEASVRHGTGSVSGQEWKRMRETHPLAGHPESDAKAEERGTGRGGGTGFLWGLVRGGNQRESESESAKGGVRKRSGDGEQQQGTASGGQRRGQGGGGGSEGPLGPLEYGLMGALALVTGCLPLLMRKCVGYELPSTLCLLPAVTPLSPSLSLTLSLCHGHCHCGCECDCDLDSGSYQRAPDPLDKDVIGVRGTCISLPSLLKAYSTEAHSGAHTVLKQQYCKSGAQGMQYSKGTTVCFCVVS